MPTRPDLAGDDQSPGVQTDLRGADGSGRGVAHGDVLVSLHDVAVHYELRANALTRLVGGASATVKAVDGVSLDVHRGEVLGLVGESGSGKTTLGRALLGLVKPTAGSIDYAGQDVAALPERRLRPLRRQLQMVFQDPHAALNPSMDLLTAIGHPLRIQKLAKGRDELRSRVVEVLERVGLTPAEQFLTKLPTELSGGQKQRAVIARSIICDPELLVADEPVSMLDMSVRAKVLELMLSLKDDLDLTYVYITHDLATAKFFCDRVAIMYLGRIVEIGSTSEIFANPRHPYTQSLLKAVPEPDPDKALPRDLPRGEIPDAAAPPLGCSFHPRCPEAFEKCGWERRDLATLIESHWTRHPETDYETESALIGNLADLNDLSHEAVLRPGRGRTAAEVGGLLARIKDEDPAEPLWRGVSAVDVGGDEVTVRFHEGEDPRLRGAGDVDVACHLY